jgi:hypothetical protein
MQDSENIKYFEMLKRDVWVGGVVVNILGL